MIDLKRAIKQGGGDYILWLSVTCAPIDVLPPISVSCSTFWPLNFNIVSRNYCYWRMDFWQLILYPLAVCRFSLPMNVCLVIVFVCFRKFYFMTLSSILRILLKPQLNFILFNFNFSFFSSVELNSVGIELFVNMGYFINVFFFL